MTENKENTAMPTGFESGLFVSGIVVSSTARAFNLKKRVGIGVSVRHELAYDGGMLSIEEFIDPNEDRRVRVEGLQVVEFPQLKAFEPVRFRIDRFRVFNNQLVATKAERMVG